MKERFKDRTEAGKALARQLARYADDASALVCALPRGGVVLGVEVAKALRLGLDLLIPRKIGHPDNDEYAIAAVTETGAPVVAPEEAAMATGAWFEAAVREQRREAKRRRETYLPAGAPRPLEGMTVLIVDDGVATGLTMRAAILEARQRGARRVVAAVPFGPRDVMDTLVREADEVVTVFVPEDYAGAVGMYYDDFPQIEDAQVVRMMRTI